jgi:hypothetical protein
MMDAPSCPDCPDFGRDRVVKAPSAERFVVQKVLAPLHPQGGRLSGILWCAAVLVSGPSYICGGVLDTPLQVRAPP